MTRKFYDGMGNDMTSYVLTLEENNNKLLTENLKLKHQLEIKQEATQEKVAPKKVKTNE